MYIKKYSKLQRIKKPSKRGQFLLIIYKFFYQIGQVPCEQSISVIIEFTLSYGLEVIVLPS
jgi:hypothetical protein